jgi:hypothetical protein
MNTILSISSTIQAKDLNDLRKQSVNEDNQHSKITQSFSKLPAQVHPDSNI